MMNGDTSEHEGSIQTIFQMATFTFCFNLTSPRSLTEQNEVRKDCKDVLMGEKQIKLFILKIKEEKVKSVAYCAEYCRAFVFRSPRK